MSMSLSNIAVLFYLKKPKKYRTGPMPIYMRFTIDGDRGEISVGRNAEPARWNRVAGKMNGTKEDARELNEFLELQRSKVFELQRRSLIQAEQISAEAIKDKMLGRDRKQEPGILQVFKQHNDELKMLIGKEYAMSTIVRYSTTLEHTRSFISWKYKSSDLSISKLNYEFISQFEFWFKSVRNCNHNSTIKYISNFRKVVNRCVKYGMLSRDPFAGFSMKKREVTPEFLNDVELSLLKQKSFSSHRLTAVRDAFLFCCFTGLAFIDVQKLSKLNIRPGN